MTELGALMLQQIHALNQQLRTGLDYGHQHAAQDMRALFEAYHRALLNPDAKIPTTLHLAIEELRKKYAP